MSFFKSSQQNNEKTIDPKLLKKVKTSEEYLQNEMQINCIRKVLIERLDVSEILLDWLQESIEQNVLLEHGLKIN